jgi:hypothetical protein
VAPPPPARPVTFEYVGPTTLRAVGPVSRRDYWFGQRGTRVVVDGRDAPSLDTVPNLKRVAS